MTSQTPRILIIDDEEVIRANLVAYFEDEEYEVMAVPDGESAMDLLQSYAADVVIVDMRLPGIDGNHLIQKIKGQHDHIKFLIHTGSASYAVPPELEVLGIREEHIVKKPALDMSIFTRRIKKLVEK